MNEITLITLLLIGGAFLVAGIIDFAISSYLWNQRKKEKGNER